MAFERYNVNTTVENTLDRRKQAAWTISEGDGFLEIIDRLNKVYAEDRISLITDCLNHYIKKAHPYNQKRYAGYHSTIFYYYNILTREINENTPTDLRQEIISVFFKHIQLNFYEQFVPVIIYSNFLVIHISIWSLVSLRKFLNFDQQQILIQQTIIFMNLNLNSLLASDKVTIDITPGNKERYTINMLDALSDFYDVMTLHHKKMYVKAYLNVTTYFHDVPDQDNLHRLLEIANKIDRSNFENIIMEYFSENPAQKKVLADSGYLEKLNLVSIKLDKALTLYPGISDSSINTEVAFELFSEIPAWSKKEYAEAQFWLANLVCHHSNFAPDDFKTETIENKRNRLLEMKPYIDAAALAENELAQVEKLRIDEELRIISQSNDASMTALLRVHGQFSKPTSAQSDSPDTSLLNKNKM